MFSIVAFKMLYLKTLLLLIHLLMGIPCLGGGAKKTKIRISTGDTQQTMIAKWNSNGEIVDLTGIGTDYMDWMSKRYKLTPVIVQFYKSKGGQQFTGIYENGSWTGVVGDLINDVADWGIVAGGTRADYISYVELTASWVETSFAMFIPFPEAEINVWSFVKPFTPMVWLMVGASLAVASTAMWLLNSSSRKLKNKPTKTVRYGSTLLYYFTVLAAQGAEWNHKGKSFVVLSSAWCLAAVVIVNAYNGVLISHLTVAGPKPLVSSLADLASKPEIKFFSYNNSNYAFSLLNAESGVEKILGERLREHPEYILPTPDDCLKQVEKGPHVCFMTKSSGEKYFKLKYRATKKCSGTRLPGFSVNFNPVFLVQKNSPLYPKINGGILWIRAAGLQRKWHSNFILLSEECMMTQKTSTKQTKIALTNLSGAFILLGIGCGLAFVAFLFELALAYVKKKALN